LVYEVVADLEWLQDLNVPQLGHHIISAGIDDSYGSRKDVVLRTDLTGLGAKWSSVNSIETA